MSQPFIPRDEAARQLAVTPALLTRYEARGLIHAIRNGDVEGYDALQIHRIWSVVSYQRDLGINLAGVEAILKLRDHLAEVHLKLGMLADQWREEMDDQMSADHDA